MSILLKILAVIGIALLVLLGILLFVILVVLFVPITYRLRGQLREEEKLPTAHVDVHWLFGMLRFRLDYEQNLTYRLKFLWFDLTGLIRKKAAAGDDDIKSEQDTVSGEGTVSSASNTDMPKLTDEQTSGQTSDRASEQNCEQASEQNREQASEQNSEETRNAPKQTLREKIEALVFKIKSFCGKIKNIKEQISYYKNLLLEEDTKGLIAHCCSVLGNILKSIRPRRLKLQLLFGFEGPDTTGKVYGMLCMLYPYYGKDIVLTPDFERQILSGQCDIKGHLLVCVLLWNGLRILFDRKLYKVIHKLKNGGKRNDK